MQADNVNLTMAKATGPDLDNWEFKGTIGTRSVPTAYSDTSRAIKLASGWYIPVGVDGVHWFRADDETMMHATEKSTLFHATDPLGRNTMECPDVFKLGDKYVILGSFPGLAPLKNTEGTNHWWVGTISDDDLHFTAESTGRFDYGQPGFSSMYAAKSGTQASAPFTRRLLFAFAGWRQKERSSCGGFYIIPRDLSLSPSGKLLQHPVAEMKALRHGSEMQGTTLAAGGQIEVLVQCQVPSVKPTAGVLGVNTLQQGGEFVQVGYDFGTMSGFATVPASLGGGIARTDRTDTLQTLFQGSTIELHVFVDGQMIETFFQGETSITTGNNNAVPTNQLTSSFVNTANLDCKVSSWVLGYAIPEGWTPTYCSSCEIGTNVIKDLGADVTLGDCIHACVEAEGCVAVDWAETTDWHCMIFSECKSPMHQQGCDPSKHDWWSIWKPPASEPITV